MVPGPAGPRGAQGLTGPAGSTGALISEAETDPQQNLYVTNTGYSSAFQGRQFSVRTAPANRSNYAYAGDASMLLDPGAGVNGPANAGYGRIIGAVKAGFPNATTFGEIDPLLITARQSGPTATSAQNASDCNGIQGNVQMSGWPGFLSFIESQTSRIDPSSYALTHSIRVQIGAIDPFGKNGEQGLSAYAGVSPLSFAYGAVAEAGTIDRGLYLTQVGSGILVDAIHIASSPGNPVFRVQCADGSVLFGGGTAYVRAVNIGGALNFYDAAGTLLLALNQGGAADVPLARSKSVVYQPLSALPGNAVEGQTAYLASTHKLYTFDGSVWQPHW
jgi:hypothetical protein